MKTLKKQPNLNDNTVATYVCQCVCYCSCGGGSYCICKIEYNNGASHYAIVFAPQSSTWGNEGVAAQGNR